MSDGERRFTKDIIPEDQLGVLPVVQEVGTTLSVDEENFKLPGKHWFRASKLDAGDGFKEAVNEEHAVKVQRAFEEAVKELHHAVTPPAARYALLSAALRASALAGEMLRLHASQSPEAWVGDSESELGRWRWEMLVGASGYGAVEFDDQDDMTLTLRHFKELMEGSYAVTGIHPLHGPFRKRLDDLDDLQWLVENTEFSPSKHCAEMVPHTVRTAPELTFSWGPVVVDDASDWKAAGLYGPHHGRLLTLHVAHRTHGHVMLLFAAHLEKNGTPLMRLAGAAVQSVKEHRDDETLTIRDDPFGERPGAAEWVGVSDEQIRAEREEDEAAGLRQAALMMRKLSEMLEQRADEAGQYRGEGWEDLEDEGEDVKRQDDPFEGLIINRKPVKA